MTLLHNGLLFDGSGAPPRLGDLRLNNNGQPDQTIDCTGLAISPGFVDLHSHADLQILEPAKREKLKHMRELTRVLDRIERFITSAGPALARPCLTPTPAASSTTIGTDLSSVAGRPRPEERIEPCRVSCIS